MELEATMRYLEHWKDWPFISGGATKKWQSWHLTPRLNKKLSWYSHSKSRKSKGKYDTCLIISLQASESSCVFWMWCRQVAPTLKWRWNFLKVIQKRRGWNFYKLSKGWEPLTLLTKWRSICCNSTTYGPLVQEFLLSKAAATWYPRAIWDPA